MDLLSVCTAIILTRSLVLSLALQTALTSTFRFGFECLGAAASARESASALLTLIRLNPVEGSSHSRNSLYNGCVHYPFISGRPKPFIYFAVLFLLAMAGLWPTISTRAQTRKTAPAPTALFAQTVVAESADAGQQTQ